MLNSLKTHLCKQDHWSGNWEQVVETCQPQFPFMRKEGIISMAQTFLTKDFGVDPDKLYSSRDRVKLIKKIQKAERSYEKAKANILQDHFARQSHFNH